MNTLIRRGWPLLISMFLIVGCESASRENKLLLQGNEALNTDQIDLAIKNYTAAIKVKRNYAEAYNNRGVAYFESDNLSMALSDYNSALLYKNSFPDARWNRARVLYALGQPENALEDLNLLSDSLYRSRKHLLKGLIMIDKANFEEAEKSFRLLLKENSDNYEAKVNLANVLYYQGSYQESLSLLTDYDKPSAPEALNVKALDLIALTEFDSARHYLDVLERYFPDNYIYHNNKALLCLKEGKLEQAEVALNESYKINSNNAWWWKNKASLAMLQGDTTTAKEAIIAALSFKTYVKGLSTLTGDYLRLLHEKDSACYYYNKSASQKEQDAIDKLQQFCSD